jgi:hypothetical protein
MRVGPSARAAPAYRLRCDVDSRPGCLLALTTSLLTASAPATAQEWRVQPSFDVGVSYEDNIALDPENPESGFGPTARAAVRALRTTEASSLGLLAGLRLNEVTENSDLSDVAAFVGADGSYLTPRSELRLNLSLSTQSTLTSETATTGVGDAGGQQYRLDIRPGWTYRLSERSTLGVNATYTDVLYDGVDDTSLSDYRSGSLSVSAGRSLTEIAGVSLVVSYGRYESQGNTNESENLALQLGAEYQVSETLSVDALFGLRRTETTFRDIFGRSNTEDSTGPTYSVSIQKRLARGGGLSLRALRELAPSGAAEVLDTSSLQLGYTYPFNERLSLQLSSRAYRNRQPSGETSTSDRTYADGQVGLSYRIRPAWRIALGYRYRWQEYDEDPSSAQSNRVTLSLAWSGR